MILDEYKREKPNILELEKVVDKMLHDMVAESGVMVAGVAGIGHVLTGVGIILLIVSLKKTAKTKG